ncbi:hypothetical protein ABZX85_49985 [Streptomyces sp. NPDC004539]|uniref:hypothetical protein n=1 Tax=Streptomyces sp. NPDC004539 TaxID=3154280 RepID=UPI0033A2B971
MPPFVDDRHWRASARFAAGCALTFAALALLTDWDAGTLTPPRAALWLALATALLLVLLPAHVTASPGRISSRGPLRRQTLHTDELVSVRQHGGASAHLVLRDTRGTRLQLDPRVLAGSPLLWHELDTGVRRSRDRGTLRQGTEVLARLTREIDGETAKAVLRASGMI